MSHANETPARVKVTGLSKRFGDTAALDGVSLALRAGEVHALLGGNGSGKSTLIKVLAGVHTGEAGGTIVIDGDAIDAAHVSPGWSRRAGFSFVHQDLGLFEPMTVAENLVAGEGYPRWRGTINWKTMRREAQEMLDQLGIDVRCEAELSSLRPAERTLVAIARALRGREQFHAGVLVLDEPTARLPEPEVELLMAAMRRYARDGQTILYVSHRLDEVFALADRATVLRDGRVVASRALDGLGERELVELIVGRSLAEVAPMPERKGSSPAILDVRELSSGPVKRLTFELHAGEVIGIAGLVGSGRTTLLETIYGARPIESGTISLDGRKLEHHNVAGAIRAGLSYVPEDRAAHGAFLTMAIPENLSAGDPGRYFRRMWFRHRAERDDAASAIAEYRIRAPGLSAPFSALSGGNQQKVVVARWLRRAPKVLLLDEPTQGVDVGARAEIYEQIRGAVLAGAAALLVSSDFDELLVLADRVLVLVDGRLVTSAPAASIDRHWLGQRVYAIPQEVAA